MAIISKSKDKSSAAILRQPGKAGLVGVYLAFIAVVVRTFTSAYVGPLLSRYLLIEFIFLFLYTAVWWRPRSLAWLNHAYLAIQSILVLVLLSFGPDFDSVVLLFLLLTYQASLFCNGRTRWAWIAAFVVLTGGSLVFFLGFFRGFGLALTGMAVEVVVAGFVIINEEIESAKNRSQSLIKELMETHSRLQEYAGKAEELAALQERDRLAASLRDNVSQLIFSISLSARSAQLLLDKETSRVPSEVTRLQTMTEEALRHLRSLISQLRR